MEIRAGDGGLGRHYTPQGNSYVRRGTQHISSCQREGINEAIKDLSTL